MEIKVTFVYDTKTIKVTSSPEDEMTKLFEKFIIKVNASSKINDYIFYYEGNILDHNSTISKNPLISDKKDISISVQKKLRIVKCPKCKCNDCIINLSNYQLTFYGCKYAHLFTDIYDNYLNTQVMELSEVRCSEPGCEHTQKNDNLDFYLCLSCQELSNRTKFYCNKCISTHDKEHFRIKFDEKNYYCKKHFHKFIKYCFLCKKNLCDDCVKEHSDHNNKSYESMISNIDNLKKNLELIKKNIGVLKHVINDIKYNLDGAIRIFKRYYEIANDVITKYELFNKDLKNYRILKSLRNINFSNNKIMEDLNKIIDEKNIMNRIDAIVNIYKTKRDDYKGNIAIIDYNKDNDDDWIEEIKKNEEKVQSSARNESNNNNKEKKEKGVSKKKKKNNQ